MRFALIQREAEMQPSEWLIKPDGHRYVKRLVFRRSFQMQRVPDDDGVAVKHPIPKDYRWRYLDCLTTLQEGSVHIP